MFYIVVAHVLTVFNVHHFSPSLNTNVVLYKVEIHPGSYNLTSLILPFIGISFLLAQIGLNIVLKSKTFCDLYILSHEDRET